MVPASNILSQSGRNGGLNWHSNNNKSHKSITSENLDAFYFAEQEKNIFMLSLKGLAIKQIASDLNISHRTVEKHRSSIIRKTETTNFIETISKIHYTIHGEMI